MTEYIKTNFGLYNDENDPIYEGFYNPSNPRWNGWLNPYVTKEVFDKIVEDVVPKVFNPDWDDEDFWIELRDQKPNKDNLYFVGMGLCWCAEDDFSSEVNISELDELTLEWNRWLSTQSNLNDKPYMDAQEALLHDLSEYQRRYVTHFSLRWETAQNDEYARWEQAQSTEEENA